MKKTLSLLLWLVPIISFALPEFCSIKIPGLGAKQIINDILPRQQWNENNGYCGEVSIISAGLYYGQYVSQYDARRLANLSFKQPNKQLTQILIGKYGNNSQSNNVIQALKRMHLNYEQFNNLNNTSSKQFLLWVKKQVVAFHPVAIGVYENSSIFDNKADPEYDHIVPVFGIKSTHNLLPLGYFDDDIIYFHDNNLYTESTYDCYQYLFNKFQKTRTEANQEGGAIYSLSNNKNGLGNFGIAITGPRVKGVELLPISIQTNPTYEYPEIIEKSDSRPHAESIKLSVQVSNLKKQQYYILYKYNDFNQLPADDDFSLSYGQPVKTCSIWLETGGQFKFQEQIASSSMAIYRAIIAKPGAKIPPSCVSQ